MSELRLTFAKEGKASYISHLDLMRTFQRVFIRAGLVIRHSNGFHPHPRMSFVLSLSVGQTSVCEQLDFETVEDISTEGMVERLAPYLPEGVTLLDCHVPVSPVRDMLYLLADVTLEYDKVVPEGAAEKITAYLLGDSVVTLKRNKKKQMVETEIRPMIQSVTAETVGNAICLHVKVQAQNPGVNPALLISAVEGAMPELAPDFVTVHRTAMLCKDDTVFR